VTVDATNATTTSTTTFAQASAATPQTTQSGRSSPTADTTAPTVSLTAPASGATVSGTVNLTATASDNIKVAGVQFLVDGTALGAEDTKSPYRVSWNTTTATNGTYTLTAVARDAAGNTTTSEPVTVTVNNPDTTPPMVSVTPPAGGAPVSGTVTLAATASDNTGVVAGVQFRLDGANLGAEDTSSVDGYGVSWNTTTATNGIHTLTAVARDAAGNITTSAPVTVTVNNNPDTTAPTVSLIGPATGATVKGTVNLGATATDNVGVAGVQFLLDDAALGAEDPTSPYGPVSWNTATVSDGIHTLTAVARDAAGNTTTSAPVTVTVANASNHPPELQGEPTVGAADLDTGRVSGSFTIIDEDADILSYIITGPFNGDVAVYHQWESPTDLTHTFNYTYTPTQAARDQAAQTSGPDTDGFSVEIGDGAARTWVNVTVPIEPRPTGIPIWQGPTTDTFDPVTGISTGNINAIDPDNDPLGYSVVYGPWYGTLDLDTETGEYTYTPTGTGDLNLGELVTIGVSDGQYTIYRDWWLWTFVTFAPL
jgi:Bacterial Ig domain